MEKLVTPAQESPHVLRRWKSTAVTSITDARRAGAAADDRFKDLSRILREVTPLCSTERTRSPASFTTESRVEHAQLIEMNEISAADARFPQLSADGDGNTPPLSPDPPFVCFFCDFFWFFFNPTSLRPSSSCTLAYSAISSRMEDGTDKTSVRGNGRKDHLSSLA